MIDKATLAGGCFWCTEAVFKRLKGVRSVTPGYSGGTTPHPTTEQVYAENTGHAEAVRIEFDPSILSYDKLLEIFFHLHDPTTLNQQGADTGPLYRSAIFYHSEEQKQIAQNVKRKVDSSKIYPGPIVTEIIPLTNFYAADNSNKNFYESGQRPMYCRLVIDPKIQKLLTEFKDTVK